MPLPHRGAACAFRWSLTRGFTTKGFKGYKMNKTRIVQADGSSFFIETPAPWKIIVEETPLREKPAYKPRVRKTKAGLADFDDLFKKERTY
eukprot:1395431-Amorphochlora_amoeboformis.AAC.1